MGPVNKTIMTTVDLGRNPEALALSADEEFLYVADHLDPTLTVVSLASSEHSPNRAGHHRSSFAEAREMTRPGTGRQPSVRYRTVRPHRLAARYTTARPLRTRAGKSGGRANPRIARPPDLPAHVLRGSSCRVAGSKAVGSHGSVAH